MHIESVKLTQIQAEKEQKPQQRTKAKLEHEADNIVKFNYGDKGIAYKWFRLREQIRNCHNGGKRVSFLQESYF